MKPHIQIVAALNIASGALTLLGAVVIFLVMGGAGGIGAVAGDAQAAGIVGIVAMAIVGFLVLLSLPSILAGWGLFTEKSWARPLAIVLAVIHLLNVPIGTAMGIYTLWALLSEPTPPPLPPAPRQIAA